MAYQGRRNQRYYPSNNPKNYYRRSYHINQLPNAIETETPQNEPHTPQNVGNNKWSTADRIAFWGLFVNITLAFVTYLLYQLSVGAADSAKISANAAKLSADLQKAALDSQVSAKKQSDIADAAKLKRDTDFINKQKVGIDAQIAAMKETQKQFIISHSPYITVKDFTFRDNDIAIEITNEGTQIADALEQDVSIRVDTPKRSFKTNEDVFKWLPIKRMPFNFQTLISPNQEIIFPASLNDISTSDKQKTKNGFYVFFIRVVVYYFNTATEKTMKYESVYKYNPETGARATLYSKYSIPKKYP